MTDGEIKVTPLGIRKGGLPKLVEMEEKLGHKVRAHVHDVSRCIEEIAKLESIQDRDAIAELMYNWARHRVYALGYSAGGKLATEFGCIMRHVSAEMALWLDSHMSWRSGHGGDITYDQADALATRMDELVLAQGGGASSRIIDMITRSHGSWEWLGVLRKLMNAKGSNRAYNNPATAIIMHFDSGLHRQWNHAHGDIREPQLRLLRTWWGIVLEDKVEVDNAQLLGVLHRFSEVAQLTMETGLCTVRFGYTPKPKEEGDAEKAAEEL